MKVDKNKERDLWHARLGHASFDKIFHVDIDISVDRNFNIKSCDACIRAKQSKWLFPISSIKSKSCFDIIHCDIWKRFPIASNIGAHYFFSIVDDHIRYMWIYFMQNKYEVETCLLAFIKLIESQFNKTIKCVRVDNGREFISKKT